MRTCTQLCLPEEDVWRRVLRWGCHRVGCSELAGERSEREREKLKLVGASSGLWRAVTIEIDSSYFWCNAFNTELY